MHARCFKRNRVHVALAVLVSISVVGCATRPVSQTDPVAPRFDIEGTWSWVQDPWEGEFVLKKEGSSYSGTLDDVFEGTFGDKIDDVEVSGDKIKFTRYGRFGVQQWEGTLKEQDSRLTITDGRWTKGGDSGTFYAEKKK